MVDIVRNGRKRTMQIRCFKYAAIEGFPINLGFSISHLVSSSNSHFRRIITNTNTVIFRSLTLCAHSSYILLQLVNGLTDLTIIPIREISQINLTHITVIITISKPTSHLHQDVKCSCISVEIAYTKTFQCQSS